MICFDADVHHGNGTEETVRWLKPGVETEEIVSPLCFGTINTPLYKPWRDVDDPSNVLFVSVHGYGTRERGLEYLFPRAAFYPGTGKTAIPDLQQISSKPASTLDDYVIPNGENGRHDEAKMENEDDESSSGSEEQDTNGQHKPVFANDDDDDDDDDEDDEDYVGSGDDDDDEEAAVQMSADSDNEDDDAPLSRTDKMRRMYSTHASFSGSSSSKATPEPLPSLILDIGMSLPADADDENADVGTAYRYQWRSYFRY
jgi:hypothetical protein